MLSPRVFSNRYLRCLLFLVLSAVLCSWAPLVWGVCKFVGYMIVSYGAFVGLDIAAEKTGLKDKLYGTDSEPDLDPSNGVASPGLIDNPQRPAGMMDGFALITSDGSQLQGGAAPEASPDSAATVRDLIDDSLLASDGVTQENQVDILVQQGVSVFQNIPFWYNLLAANVDSPRDLRFALERIYPSLTGYWGYGLTNREVAYNIIDQLRDSGDLGIDQVLQEYLASGEISESSLAFLESDPDEGSYAGRARFTAGLIVSQLLEEGGDYASL